MCARTKADDDGNHIIYFKDDALKISNLNEYELANEVKRMFPSKMVELEVLERMMTITLR